MTQKTKAIIDQINLDNEESTARALEQAEKLTDLTDEEKVELAGTLSSLFYRDLAGRTGMIKLAGKAEKITGKLGMEVVGFLISELVNADSESAAHLGRAIAQNGKPAVKPVIDAINTHRSEDFAFINLISAFAYFRDAEAITAMPEILVAAKSANRHVRSEALHSAGRLVKNLDSTLFDDKLKLKIFDIASSSLSDQFPLVRRNAAYVMGKLVKKGMIAGELEGKAQNAFSGLLGLNGKNNWDNAFIVRREVEKYMNLFRHDLSAKNKYHQSFRILEKRELCPDTYHFTIQAPLIAAKIQAGQFIIVRPSEYSERIPLSICGWDREKGTIHIIVMAAGRTSREITRASVGTCLADIVGPLGTRSHVKKHEGVCVVIGGGYGTGAVIPTAKDLVALGNKVIGVVGARNEKLLIMVDELKKACSEVMVTTNDGSAGIQGFVTHALEAILKRGDKISHVLAVGPVPMMIAVSNMTKPLGIETFVSLNAIMVDGTGMCGSCRVLVGGETKFACFHGPDFDGHKVDFDQLMKRQKMFVAKEKESMAYAEGQE
jgi:NAD(P)H-flavin reductase